MISLQVTSECNTILFETRMPHLALAAPRGITDVSPPATFLKISKHVCSESK